MKIQPHITFERVDNDQIKVSVEDTELFDFIEDILVEKNNLAYRFVTTRTCEGTTSVHEMFYSNEDELQLKQALATIDSLEIERIFQISNAT